MGRVGGGGYRNGVKRERMRNSGYSKMRDMGRVNREDGKRETEDVVKMEGEGGERRRLDGPGESKSRMVSEERMRRRRNVEARGSDGRREKEEWKERRKGKTKWKERRGEKKSEL